MRSPFLVILALLLTSCSDVRSFEETAPRFERDRAALQVLAEAVAACEEASNFIARRTKRMGCVGDIARELHRLGYHSAFASDGRWRIGFVNGDDGAWIGNVTSGIAYYRAPGTLPYSERPLTPPPHRWFYFQHD